MIQLCTRLAVALALCLVTVSTSFAEGFGLYEYSARGLALGGATVARKPDASAVAWNPALLTRLPGVNIMAGMTLIRPSGSMDIWDESGNKHAVSLRDSLWPVPHAYYTHQINDRFTFGIGEFSRFGLGLEYPNNWPGRFNIYEVALTSASLNPNLAWKATDKLSLAAGVELVYVNLDLKKRNKVNLPGGSMEVDANIQDATTWGVGFNLAAHYQFNEQWAAGLTYRSQVRVHAKGDMEFSLVSNDSALPDASVEGIFSNNFKNGGAHSTVYLPDAITGAVSYSPTPKLSVELAATWTRWSSFRHLNIHIDTLAAPSNSNKHWSDAWRISAGVEYALTDWLDLRAGYTFDQSPMEGQYADYLVPTSDRDIYSVGLGFKHNAWTADVAYAYISAGRRSYKPNNETHVLRSKTNGGNNTQLFSLSIGYSF